MKVTAIKQQYKKAGRYSIFLDDKYSFSLSGSALLESKLVVGQELDAKEADRLKNLSDEDKLYNQVLGYIAIRQRSRWEVEAYLKRKQVSPALSDNILNTLSNKKLIDDTAFARAWVNNRTLLRPTSRRKLFLELKQKRVKDEVIQAVLDDVGPNNEKAALLSIINSKRRQSRYKDNLKLMQYLSRQGFGYSDIKAALKKSEISEA